MSDTPETDANAHNVGSLEQPHYVVDVEIAQDLELCLKAAEAECLEQCRLLAMSGEREAKLIAENDVLRDLAQRILTS